MVKYFPASMQPEFYRHPYMCAWMVFRLHYSYFGIKGSLLLDLIVTPKYFWYYSYTHGNVSQMVSRFQALP
jgi:hypothetical protein